MRSLGRPRQRRGGQETAQHEWVKFRLTRIARQLGYTAIPEHPPTRADVFVQELAYCLEVQLRSTQFTKRTQARRAKGGQVCWWIVEGPDTKALTTALFTLPAIRFRVIDKNDPRGRPLAPWADPGNRDLAFRARLQVFATVAHAPARNRTPRTSSSWFRTGTMDGYTFLAEILSGRRRWYTPYLLGQGTGLWALDSDVEAFRAFRRQERASTRTTTLPVGTPNVPGHALNLPPATAIVPAPAPPAIQPDPPTVSSALPPPAPPEPDPNYRRTPPPATTTALTHAPWTPPPPRPRRWWQFWRLN
ncbi:competence protein CoiA family protein [Fodinicola feengrottensis]